MHGKYYVYKLKIRQPLLPFMPSYNPCNTSDGTFYVGKGSGNRMYAHEVETRGKLKRGNKSKLSYKNKVIIQCWDRGVEIDREVVMRTDDEDEAFRVENELITHYGLEYLTNISYGRRPTGRRRQKR